ncbi:hypothetical protein [Fuchsiella alkaliacetigena]|uniref:hypothetical protein n=1 Tax=Fuchsiella alkaliacetigena TaxID=957042 RepID=UPI00200B2F2D|nr:hypothetical protein [Fuchsiella alkaliacetigena]MCK8824108.1 hypothetical protein [Fuchsiella alkaliacetigena]
MRRISYLEYKQKRKSARLDFLKLRDSLDKEPSQGLRERNPDKRLLLFKLAEQKRERFLEEGVLEKLGQRKYRIDFKRND